MALKLLLVKVYAAYYYEAGRDDELSLEEGEELRVIRRNEWPDDEAIEHPDEGFEWWLCERTDHRQEARTINGKQKGLGL
jgi:hypothetical protein